MGTSTQSYFIDTETSTGNAFSAGKIDLVVDGENPWTRTNHQITMCAKPCTTYYDTITLKNTGCTCMKVWKHIKNVVTVENGITEPEQDYYDANGIGSMKGYWRFEEGAPWDGTVDEVKDRSPYENHGTAHSGAIQSDPGKVGQCAEFDGDDDYIEVECGPGSSLNLETAVSIEAWVYPHSLGGYQAIVSKHRHDTLQRGYYLGLVNSNVQFCLSDDGSTLTCVSSGTIPSNTWTHITATSDASTMKLYINGAQDPNTKVAPSTIHQNTLDLRIGKYDYGGLPRHFDGKIDEVAIWDRALTETEIEDIYNDPGILEGSGNDLDSVILYDMWIDNDDDPSACDPGNGDEWLIHDLDGLHIDDVECNYIPLGVLAPDEEMVIVQSYHMEGDTGNWAQSDQMIFTVEFYAQQHECDDDPFGPSSINARTTGSLPE